MVPLLRVKIRKMKLFPFGIARRAKEISIRNLANIIQARMEEIVEHVYYEIKNSGFEKNWWLES